MQAILAFLLALATTFHILLAGAAEPEPVPAPAPPPAAAASTPHIALLLPLLSGSFGTAAEAVRQGVAAAEVMNVPTLLPLKTYSTGDRPEDIVSAYRQALQAGARVVIGPLTRNAVTELAKSSLVTVPTLALNGPDGEVTLSDHFYQFGLTAESEARQTARIAFKDGRRNALIVHAETPLAKRVQLAFADAWKSLGGKVVGQASFSPERTQFPALRDKVHKQSADMIFIAADASRARLVRPYLDANIPTYATSMIFGGNLEISLNIDLNGVTFAEMPWFLLPDHPAVMIYPRAGNFSIEQDRLYALGIDAYRLATLLVKSPRPSDGSVLDGVTGQIRLSEHLFQREMAVAQFRQGQAVAIEFADPNSLGQGR
jgi:hypothetical protein